MGTLIYDSTDGYDFDDMVLAHLQSVITAKLRRKEAFLLTWMDRTSSPSGTLRSIWLTEHLSVQFVFSGPSLPRVNRDWVAVMARKANSNVGLRLEDDLRATIRAANTDAS